MYRYGAMLWTRFYLRIWYGWKKEIIKEQHQHQQAYTWSDQVSGPRATFDVQFHFVYDLQIVYYIHSHRWVRLHSSYIQFISVSATVSLALDELFTTNIMWNISTLHNDAIGNVFKCLSLYLYSYNYYSLITLCLSNAIKLERKTKNKWKILSNK